MSSPFIRAIFAIGRGVNSGSLGAPKRAFWLGLFALIGFRLVLVSPLFLPVLLFPLLLLLVTWLYIKSLRNRIALVARSHPEVCRQGERVRVDITLDLSGDLPFFYGLARDAFPATDTLEGPEILLYPDVAGKNLRFSYDVAANRGYGDFLVGPLSLTVFDPLEIFSEEITLAGQTSLKVFLQPFAGLNVDFRKENSLTPLGDSRAQKPGSSMDFFGVDEFRPGHDIRHLCWNKWAQTGRLIVREFEFDSRSDVVLIVNTDAAQIKGFGFGNNLKRALRVAAGILEGASGAGLPLRVVIPGEDDLHVFSLRPSANDLIFGLEFLANLKGSRHVDFPALLHMGLSFVTPSTLFLAVSHTLSFDMESFLAGMFAVKAKKGEPHFFSVDDRQMIRFDSLRGEEFPVETLETRLNDLGIGFRIVRPRELEPQSEL